MIRALAPLLMLLVLWPRVGAAHEVRPAYLEIREDKAGAVHLLWKQPALGEVAVRLNPRLSSGWLDGEPARRILGGDFLAEEWTIRPPHAPVAGQTVRVDGLDRTITDVLVRWQTPDGNAQIQMLRPAAPSAALASATPSGVPVLDYLALGVTHIWTGFDHLLYVLGLILLTPRLRVLLKTITAFTIAHSLTLAASVLDLVRVSPPVVEAAIALSIVFVAVELVKSARGQAGLLAHWPWLAAFAFGLLHGFGFAGALREVGLPQGQIGPALFLFNVGIECGQLLFVAAVSLGLALAAKTPRLSAGLTRGAPYVVGGLGAFWVIERVAAVAAG